MFDVTRVLSSVVGVCFGLSYAVADDQPTFETLLNTHSYSIALQEDELNGPGADLILNEASGAQFVALGEEH